MTPVDQMSVEELIAQLKLEPQAPIVVVEGTSDARLLSRVFSDFEVDPSVFVSVDQIHIPSTEVERFNLRVDNHGRVIALTFVVLERAPSSGSVFRGFVDGEYDYLVADLKSCPFLIYLDASSPEALILGERPLTKFLHEMGISHSPKECLEACLPTLQLLFCIRAANLMMNYGASWPEVRFRFSTAGVVCDESHLISRLLSSARMLVDEEGFRRLVKTLLSAARRLPVPCSIRGHDLGLVLGAYVKEHGGKERKDFAKAPNCEAAIHLCLEDSDFLELSSFKELAAFLDK